MYVRSLLLIISCINIIHEQRGILIVIRSWCHHCVASLGSCSEILMYVLQLDDKWKINWLVVKRHHSVRNSPNKNNSLIHQKLTDHQLKLAFSTFSNFLGPLNMIHFLYYNFIPSTFFISLHVLSFFFFFGAILHVLSRLEVHARHISHKYYDVWTVKSLVKSIGYIIMILFFGV